MNLIELVTYFRHGGSLDVFLQTQSLNEESEVIEIYIGYPYTLKNELLLCEIEKTEGNRVYIYNNIEYTNMFSLPFFIDMIEDANNKDNVDFSDIVIAEKILNYAINDG